MGCLNASTICTRAFGSTIGVNRRFLAGLRCENGIDAHMLRYEETRAETKRVGGIKVRYGLICSVGYINKLEVSKEHLWLIPENFFQDSFAIITEVEWHIV